MEVDQDMQMGTKPIAEHEWLQQLVGDWTYTTEFTMGPDSPMQEASGEETVTSLGGLWAVGETTGSMPDGTDSLSYWALGYDVSFKQYRGCWFGSMSSHLWKNEGELSSDGKTMTLTCIGPSMTKDGETETYQDVIHIVDKDHRTMTSYAPGEDGKMQVFMKSTYTRV